MNGLAYYHYRVLGTYAQARPRYERALAIREKVLGPEHPDTATSLNDPAAPLSNLGYVDEAESLLRRATAISDTASG